MNRTEQTPHITLSTRACLTGSLQAWQTTALRASVEGLDVDLTRLPRHLMLKSGSWPEVLARPGVRGVWLRADQLRRSLPTSFVDVAPADAGAAPPVKTIVVQHSTLHTCGSDAEAAIKAIAHLRDQLQPGTQVALSLAPTNRDRGREHLHQIQRIRHLAAEWELVLALDLLGHVDESWEAEAAVLKLVPRLSLLRIPYPIAQTLKTPRARMTRRVLSAALDGGFAGILAIAPPLKPWHFARSEVVLETTRDAVNKLRHEMRTRARVTSEPPWRESFP